MKYIILIIILCMTGCFAPKIIEEIPAYVVSAESYQTKIKQENVTHYRVGVVTEEGSLLYFSNLKGCPPITMRVIVRRSTDKYRTHYELARRRVE